jgi:hypothetical protein
MGVEVNDVVHVRDPQNNNVIVPARVLAKFEDKMFAVTESKRTLVVTGYYFDHRSLVEARQIYKTYPINGDRYLLGVLYIYAKGLTLWFADPKLDTPVVPEDLL